MKTLEIPLLESLADNDLDTALELEGARFNVDECNWPESFPYSPFCCGRIARTEDSLVVDFRVSGLDLQVRSLEDGGHVWEDSCCEIFLQKPGEKEYYNFEVNAAGVMVAARGEGRADRTALSPDDMASIVRFVGVDGAQEYSGGIFSWRVTLLIPFSVLDIDADALPEKLRGNIYKCGDATAHPHYLSWNPVGTERPDYHRPEFFGEFILA